MAEFCLDCWNEINETGHSKKKYVLSKKLDLCEGCGELKHVIAMEKKACFILPIKIICYIIWKVLTLPYLIFKFFVKRK